MISLIIIPVLCSVLIGYIASLWMKTSGGFAKYFLLGLGGSVLGSIASAILHTGWFITLLLSIACACSIIAIFKSR